MSHVAFAHRRLGEHQDKSLPSQLTVAEIEFCIALSAVLEKPVEVIESALVAAKAVTKDQQMEHLTAYHQRRLKEGSPAPL